MADVRTKQIRKLRTIKRRKMRVRKATFGTQDRPRFTVHRSLKGLYAQIIDDTAGVTLVSAGTLDAAVKQSFEDGDNKTKMSYKVGLKIAELARAKGIEKVAFDRQGFLYHGRIKAVAEGAREGGLKF